jgi:hypothetical protein
MDLAELVEAFLHASVLGRTSRAARLLVDTPAIAGYDLRTGPNTNRRQRPGRPDYCSTLFAVAGCADNPPSPPWPSI